MVVVGNAGSGPLDDRDSPQFQSQEDAVSGWLEDHLGEVAALLGFALMIAKVLRVGGDDPSTALGVLATTGILAVVAGVVAAGLSDLLLAIVPVFLISLLVNLYRRKQSISPIALVLMSVLLVVYLFQVRPVGENLFALYLSWAILLLGIIILLWCGVLWIRHDADRIAPTRSAPKWVRAASALLMVLFLAIGLSRFVNQEMWLPAERIQVVEADEKRVYVAYVLNFDERWTTLLNDNPRGIFRISSSTIEERVVCRLETGGLAPTLGARLFGSLSAGKSYLPPCNLLQQPDSH